MHDGHSHFSATHACIDKASTGNNTRASMGPRWLDLASCSASSEGPSSSAAVSLGQAKDYHTTNDWGIEPYVHEAREGMLCKQQRQFLDCSSCTQQWLHTTVQSTEQSSCVDACVDVHTFQNNELLSH